MPWQRGDAVIVAEARTWGLRRGMTGTVLFTDSQGTVHVEWDHFHYDPAIRWYRPTITLGAVPARGDVLERYEGP